MNDVLSKHMLQPEKLCGLVKNLTLRNAAWNNCGKSEGIFYFLAFVENEKKVSVHSFYKSSFTVFRDLLCT
jgi:hypothetical protein